MAEASEVYDCELDGVRCRIIESKPSGSTIVNAEGRWHGIRYYVETESGRRLWTVTFPNYDRPVEG